MTLNPGTSPGGAVGRFRIAVTSNATRQRAKAEAFRALHAGPGAFLLPNVWDAGSAKLLTRLGAKALGTTSAGVAFALGRPDQGRVSQQEMLAAIAQICAATPLPVSADLEAGYGDAAASVWRAIQAGAVGANLEDGSGDPAAPLIPLEAMVERLRLARAAADATGLPFTLNARTDGFWVGGSGEAVLAEAIARGQAYATAGADCVFIPLLKGEAEIARAAAVIPAPLNLLFLAGGPGQARLGELGVRRLSTGGALARVALAAVERAAAQLLGQGDATGLAEALPHAAAQRLFS